MFVGTFVSGRLFLITSETQSLLPS